VTFISLQEAQVWVEKTKLPLGALDTGLESQIATQVLSRIALAYNTSGWTTSSNTPVLVRSIIAMLYVSWLYDRTYSEDEPDSNAWATRLAGMAETLILGIIDGTTDLVEVTDPILQGSGPAFYPNDVSSAQAPTCDDPSLGPASFSMGSIF
jgi:hypothetical protein